MDTVDEREKTLRIGVPPSLHPSGSCRNIICYYKEHDTKNIFIPFNYNMCLIKWFNLICSYNSD